MDFIKPNVQKKHHKKKSKKSAGNIRGLAYRSGVRAAKSQKRALDIAARTHHIPREIHAAETQPPVIVSVFGSPRVGKSTLIASLVKRFNRQKISHIKGPVTIATGMRTKITLIESPNDVNSMIDLAKISDIVVVCVDAAFGIEVRMLEIFSILRTHSLPKVIGVLTHVDLVAQNKAFAKMKKIIKKRFWDEIYSGAKLISFNIFKNNIYDLKQIFILSQYLVRSAAPPASWRTSHPHILADRLEDLTNPEAVRRNPSSSRRAALYGYVHGTFLKNNKIHICGVGDFEIDKISLLDDPCSGAENFGGKHKNTKKISDSDKKKFGGDNQNLGGDSKNTRENKNSGNFNNNNKGGRILDPKKRPIYAPFSGLGGVIFDKNAIYINSENSANPQEINEQNLRLNSFQKITQTIDEKLTKIPFELFPNLPAEEILPDSGHESEPNNDISDINVNSFKELENTLDLAKGAPHIALHRLIYKENVKKEQEIKDDLFVPRENSKIYPDSTLSKAEPKFPLYSDDESFVHCLFDGKNDAEDFLRSSPVEDNDEIASNVHSLDNKSLHSAEDISLEESLNESPDESMDENNEKIIKNKKLKASKIKKFEDIKKDEKYLDTLKSEIKQNTEKTAQEFEDLSPAERVIFQGYSPGMYVRLEISNVPASFIDNFDPTFPVVIGGLLPGEDTKGFLKLRVKKCKYFQKTLKTRDPLILSIGWRRFQTVMIYANEDANKRLRYIKYTPKQMYCIGVCYGPFTLPGFGVLGIQELSDESGKGFRISLIGVTLENDQTCKVMKKLKLVGYPFKIHKNTAFIEKMFNSSLEVAKFEGGIIKTVSGIRGQIKKAINDIDGAFRAKFEDTILLSDIVSLRTWTPVECPKYYNIIQNLLSPSIERFSWLGMRTVAQLRKDAGFPIEYNKDSIYKPIEREPVIFAPLKVPKKLIAQLPFSARPKNVLSAQPKEKRPKLSNPTERKASAVLNELARIQNSISTTRKLKRKKDAEKNAEKMKKIEEEQNKKRKINSKRVYKRHILKMAKTSNRKE